MSVGAIEPVGMTNASASNVRNKNASTKAITIDSTVSRMVETVAAGAVLSPFLPSRAAVSGGDLGLFLAAGFLAMMIIHYPLIRRASAARMVDAASCRVPEAAGCRFHTAPRRRD